MEEKAKIQEGEKIKEFNLVIRRKQGVLKGLRLPELKERIEAEILEEDEGTIKLKENEVEWDWGMMERTGLPWVHALALLKHFELELEDNAFLIRNWWREEIDYDKGKKSLLFRYVDVESSEESNDESSDESDTVSSGRERMKEKRRERKRREKKVFGGWI